MQQHIVYQIGVSFMAKVSYAGMFQIVVPGRENATQEEIKDLIMRNLLRYGNKADAFEDIEVTHYKDVPLYPERELN